MIIHKCPQRSPEWFEIKKGKFSSTDASVLRVAGKGLTTLAFTKAAELLSNIQEEPYTNEAMQNGIELENTALADYEISTGSRVEVVGFVERDEYSGASPDGLVDEDGLIEIKCPTNRVFVEYLYSRKIPSNYFDQMQFQMFITERKWVDYIVFNPGFDNSTTIQRVERDEKSIAKIEAGLQTGIAQLQGILEKIKNG